MRYDQVYPVIAYSGPATHNRVWRLQQRLESGELKLVWDPRFGYLRSLLQALDINPDSQVLVFSRTSLQVEHIDAHTPRAVYFNDDTYIGYVQNSSLVEVTAIDSEKGPVFYAFDNQENGTPTHMEREGGRCLTCHDTFSMTGGGVPRVMVMSAPVDDKADIRTYTAADETDDRTPLAERWGGWYVTGRTGSQGHFGNLPLREEHAGERLRELQGKRMDLASVKAYVDSARWPTDQSDVVALLVLEHQTSLQNFITRVNYKVRTVMSRADDASIVVPRTWAEVNPSDQKRVQQMMEPLVRALFFKDAAPYEHRIEGGSGFAERFAKLGPKDSKGRSLRELDLNTRLMRHPLSYEIYSEQFDACRSSRSTTFIRASSKYCRARTPPALRHAYRPMSASHHRDSDRYQADSGATVEAGRHRLGPRVVARDQQDPDDDQGGAEPAARHRVLSPSSNTPSSSAAGGPMVLASAPRAAPMRLMAPAWNRLGRNMHNTASATSSSQSCASSAVTAVSGREPRKPSDTNPAAAPSATSVKPLLPSRAMLRSPSRK